MAQAVEPTFWNAPNGSGEWILKFLVAIAISVAIWVGLLFAPTRLRRPVVMTVTFLAGLIYVLYFFFPRPIDRDPGELPVGGVEAVSFWIDDTISVVANFTSILSGFLLGLGIYSLIRVHGRKLVKMQKDWAFSLVLLLSMATMVFFGYADWRTRLGEAGAVLDDRANWGFINYARDFFFDGLLQQMDAAMFSLIAFFILSAAYRAFRVRSIEATILLAAALIVMLSLMGAVEYLWGSAVVAIFGNNPDSFGHNFTLTNISAFLQQNIQTPSIRGIDFGIGIGALAMGLRLWLSLEKAGGTV